MKTFFIVLFGLAIISTEAAGGNDNYHESKVKAERQKKGGCFYWNDNCKGFYAMTTRESCCGKNAHGQSWAVRKSWSWHFTCEKCKRVGK